MLFARILLIVLCIVTAGLYARVLLPPDHPLIQAFSMQPQAEAELQPLPEEQMQLVIQALAPEMAKRDK